MVLRSCLQSSQVNEPKNNTHPHSKALPITLLVIGTLTVLVAALIGIPGLLSTTSSLNLPSSFAWIHAIGTPGLAAILGTGGAVGLSVIAFSSRRLCQAKHAEILDLKNMKQTPKSTTDPAPEGAKEETKPKITVMIPPRETWTRMTDWFCESGRWGIPEMPTLAAVKAHYPLKPKEFMLFNYSVITCELNNNDLTLYYFELQEDHDTTPNQLQALPFEEQVAYNNARFATIVQTLTSEPWNLSQYVPKDNKTD